MAQAHAGPPVHPPLPDPINGFALDHACGAATDSEGDIYVSNAGQSKIEVFDPSGTHLTSIPNSNTPCGLAVDTRGTLFVTEQGTGNVVRYVPDEYPFSGPPTYGPPEVIDGSGEAKAIAVDTSMLFTNSRYLIGGDDSLYVAKGDHIDAYRNEIQRIDVNATGGTYKLKFGGQETAALPYNASHAEVRAALEALTTIGPHNVSVTTANFLDTQHLLTFTHKLGLTNVSPIEVDATNLTGGGVSKSETNGGLIATNIGAGNLTEATGLAVYTYRIGSLETGTADRYVFAADAAGDEVKVLSGPSLESLKLRRTIAGPKAGEDFGFGAAGAYLAADSSNGHFFVYDDAHSNVDEFEADGELLDQVESAEFADAEPTALAVFPDRNEIQRVALSCTGGTFTLGFEGEPTAPIPCQATAAQVEEALTGLAAVGPEDVAVVLITAFGSDRSYNVIFQGALGSRDVEELEGNSSGLTGGEAKVRILFEAQGSGPGRLFVTAGAGAKLLAFSPLAPPSRTPRPELSHVLTSASAVAVDKAGNVYVGAGGAIHVFSPGGEEVEVGPKGEGIPIKEPPTADLAVDSTCNVYVLVNRNLAGDEASRKKQKVQYYSPVGGACPPEDGTQYSSDPVTLADATDFESASSQMGAIGINPANDHVFAAASFSGDIIEFDSPAPGHESKILDPCFACSLNLGSGDIAVYGRNGNVYLSSGAISVVNPTGTEVLARITGAGGHLGLFGGAVDAIAVSQSNGHVLVFRPSRGADEYEASGTFVTEFGAFTDSGSVGASGIALDNSGGPNDGNVYVAYDDPAPGTYDLTAFGPLSYGAVPVAKPSTASGIGGGNATLNGTVDPNGFEVEDCHFEYLTEAAYKQNIEEELPPFSGAAPAPCAESTEEIGTGEGPVPVHAEIGDIEPEATRYRFRLLAENKFGLCEKCQDEAGLFGPPLLEPEEALPVLYDEATLRAKIDPSGLATGYRFDYVTQAHFEAKGFEGAQGTPTAELSPGDGFVAVTVPLTGLAEGTEYRFRILAENEAKAVPGPAQTFTTLERLKGPPCPNVEYRTGLSAQLPDCRAYELVTPADTRGSRLIVPNPGTAGGIFNIWTTTPRGESAGERLVYSSATTLPGFDGTGSEGDTYRAQRAPGTHPAAGWSNELFSPTFAENGGDTSKSRGISEEQHYGFFPIGGIAALPRGKYLQTPAGLEPIGRGSLATDMEAEGRFIGPGGAHVVFSSEEHLEPEAAPQGAASIYDRVGGGSSADVVSVPPESATPGQVAAFEAAQTSDPQSSYVGASADGSTVVFEVGATMYARDESVGTEAVAPETLAEVGEPLGCANGPVAVEGGREIEWLRNSTPIPGASGNPGFGFGKYTTVPADAGTAIQCRVSVQEAGTGSVSVSNPVIRVAPLAATEAPKAPDTIDAPTPANPEAGTVESCDPGAWSGASEPLAYQWYVDGEAVPGANGETYEVKAADVPGAIQCLIEATNAGGSVSAASPVTYTNPPPDPAVPSAAASADLQLAFAGASDDGERVFFATGSGSDPSRLFSFDLETQGLTKIAEDSIFVNVSPDGSHVYFTSKQQLGDAPLPADLSDKLYLWDGSQVRFVAVLDPRDVGEGFGPFVDLLRWTRAIGPGNDGRNDSPTRSTPDGEVFVFQSHARLTAYDNEDATEIYRYDSAAPAGEAMLCVSCDPSGAPPGTDAQLLDLSTASGIAYFALIPNVTDDGQAVFFQSFDRLLPEDANDVEDVYEWLARGRGGCKRPGGCLALISSGQGERPSYLYGMSADGRDVFFKTPEKLVGADIPGSPSIYDARVQGGIPDPPEKAPCQGDACQGAATIPPVLPNPASAALGEGGNTSGEEGKRRRCAKGKRRVVRKGRPRCVKRRHRSRRGAR